MLFAVAEFLVFKVAGVRDATAGAPVSHAVRSCARRLRAPIIPASHADGHH